MGHFCCRGQRCGRLPTKLISMASRRVTKSVVDWAAFAERVPKNQVDAYRAFKAKSDIFVSNVHKYPENLPAIDWSAYKSRITMPGLVDAFEKAYSAVSVPYPADPENIKATVDVQEAEAAEKTKANIVQIQGVIDNAKSLLANIDSVPPPEVMTQEMYFDYFPDQARNPWDRPTFFPHTHHEQPGNDPHEIK